MSNTSQNLHPSIDTVDLDSGDTASVYDGDMSSEASSVQDTANVQRHFILRKKDSNRDTHSSTSTIWPVFNNELAQARQTPISHQKDPSADRVTQYRLKADYKRDMSSALRPATGQQRDRQCGYLSGTYVTILSYLDTITPAPKSRGARLRLQLQSGCTRPLT